jgi:hypothetical protein
MTPRFLRLILLLAFIPALPSRAADLTAFVGGIKPGKLSANGIRTALDSSPVFGFRLGTNFVPMLGMEHTLAFSSDYLFPHNVSAIKNPKGFVFNSNLIFNLPVGTAVPYVTAGVGLIHQYGNDSLPEGTSVGTKFAVNYGGGIKFPRLFGPFGLRFDARGYTATGVFSNRLNMLEVSGGLLLSFGK